jgi:hypothetical protein
MGSAAPAGGLTPAAVDRYPLRAAVFKMPLPLDGGEGGAKKAEGPE